MGCVSTKFPEKDFAGDPGARHGDRQPDKRRAKGLEPAPSGAWMASLDAGSGELGTPVRGSTPLRRNRPQAPHHHRLANGWLHMF